MGRILILGGVAAGMSAASRARRVDRDAQILVLERGPAAAYGACGIPYFLAGRVASLDRLLAHPAEFFTEKRQIELRTGCEVLEIVPGRRQVRVAHDGRTDWIHYDRLIVATGAAPRWHPDDLRNVFCANTWTQVQRLDEALRHERFSRALVVGAGYIGLEIAEALAQRGLQVALADAHAFPLRGFDEELAAALAERLRGAGIEWRPGSRIEGLDGARGGRILGVQTPSGPIECDLLVNCAGLRPEVALAQAAGVALGRFGGIAVDDRQQTNLPGIYAAGDCAETRHLVTGAPTWIPLGAAANQQGRVAGQNAGGGLPARFPGVVGTLAVPLFGLEFARTGLSLEQARAAGLDAASTTVTSGTQAGYLDPKTVTLKIVYQPSTRRLLGCHIVGAPGQAAARINAAAVCLTAGLRLDQMETLDLAYSPGLAPLYEPLLVAAHNALRN